MKAVCRFSPPRSASVTVYSRVWMSLLRVIQRSMRTSLPWVRMTHTLTSLAELPMLNCTFSPGCTLLLSVWYQAMVG